MPDAEVHADIVSGSAAAAASGTSSASADTASADTASGAADTVSAAIVALVATLAIATCWQGAFYRPAQVALAGGLTVTVALSLRDRSGFRRATGLLHDPVPALLAVAAWIAVATAAQGSFPDSAAGSALAIGVAAVIVVVRRAPRGDRDLLLSVLPLLGTVIAGSAWLGLALQLPRWSLVAAGVRRGTGVLTYPNATAAVLVLLALPAVALSADPDPGTDGRPPGLIPPRTMRLIAVGLIIGAATTLSRGGLLALACGLSVLLIAGGRRVRRAVAAAVVGGLVGLAALLPCMTSASVATRLLGLAAPAAGLLAAELVTRLTSSPRLDGDRPAPVRSRRRPPPALAVLAVLAAGIGSAVALAPAHLDAVAAARLTLDSTHRTGAARAAIDRLSGTWWIGAGPSATVHWREADGRSRTGSYLHDEYLQLVFDHGLVAGALLLTAVVGAVLAARRSRPRRAGPGSVLRPATSPTAATWAGGSAALVAFGVHSGLDFLWHLPALPLLAAALYAATVGSSGARCRACPDGTPTEFVTSSPER